MRTTGEFVTVLRGRHGSRWLCRYRLGDVIGTVDLNASTVEEARAEAGGLFPNVTVWAPSTGEPPPGHLRSVR